MENMGELGDQQISEPGSVSEPVVVENVEPVDSVESVETVEPADLLPTHDLDTDIERSDSAGEDVNVSSTMIDTTDFRSLTEPSYQSLNGRMSPGFTTASSYATLTPLQPLPPISTMSDKFSHYGHHGSNVSGSFTLMQNTPLGMGMNSYQYDKLGSMTGMNMSPTLGATHHSAMMSSNGLGSQQTGIPSPPYSQNGLHSPEKSMSPNGYDSYAHRDLSRGLGSPQSPTVTLHTPTSMMPTLNGLNAPHTPPSSHLQAPGSPPAPHEIKPATTLHASMPSLSLTAPTPSPAGVPLTQPSAPVQASVPNPIATSTTSIVTATNNNNANSSKSVSPASSSKSSTADDVEEINTKELAQRISAELKRYSIPQAIFAQRVLCRSQGTLSDLLRNPKPWSKLKSGRETFRRMYKWLEEPEFQRMSALRLAEYQMRNVNQRAGIGRIHQRRGILSHLQTERGTATTPKEPQYAEETSSCFYRSTATHPTSHF
ncbi:homeobox protein onecut-like isoform X2 [Centruroides sculpturatus]|uniref:homeobox protein onecut-like isoform X2 n=1 Tax=Centruroides sculpturatus TaxID=218467 RepID=UPI000C6E0E26|nr:homeobox protein onecut-like isoform X2 [Centruroides sculpturatus]